MCQKLSNIKNKQYWVIHVTANTRDSSIETGSKTIITTASLRFPNAAAQAAFMTMSEITPLLLLYLFADLQVSQWLLAMG